METLIRSAYVPMPRVQLSFKDEHGDPEESRTKQCHQDQCDINQIIKQYDKHGLITHVNNLTAEYGDYTEINEYKVNLELVIAAQQNFEELPSEIRKQFGNNPGAFCEFATNPANIDAMVKMGLANAPKPDLKPVTPVTTETALTEPVTPPTTEPVAP